MLRLGLAVVCLVIIGTYARDNKAPFYRTKNAVKGSYFIVLKDGRDVQTFIKDFSSIAENDDLKFSPKVVFQKILNGFVAELDNKLIERVRMFDAVKYVEEDGVAEATETWGLDRIDQRTLPLDDEFRPAGYGKGAHVYILDTGIRTTHEDFGGRASFVFDGMNYDVGNDGDCHGHGTHCASTATGTQYGVAKYASVYAVRVLGCRGSGTWAAIINGMDWIATNGNRPAVASMSLGGGAVRAVDESLQGLFDAGVLPIVAAGNSDWDACWFSPARAPSAITVGAMNINDTRAYFSNYGGCVDIFAPGRYITAAWKDADDQYITISGTSMATPHVAGVAAVHLGINPNLTPTELRDIILDTATRNVIKDVIDSPNLMLYVPRAP